MSIETEVIAAQFDAIRIRQGILSSLVVQNASRQGYVTTETIISGWSVEFLPKDGEGVQHLQLYIAESDSWNTFAMSNCSDFVFNNNRYKIADAPKAPIGEPLVWVIKLNPIGEKLEVVEV